MSYYIGSPLIPMNSPVVVVVLSYGAFFACDVGGVIQVAIATDGIRQTGMDE